MNPSVLFLLSANVLRIVNQLATHSVVPDVHYFAVGSRDEMIMPSVPFHLCTGRAPVTKTHDRSVKASQIPSAYAGVHGDGGHQVGVECMPVDVCDGARMGVERLEERPWRGEVPHEQLLRRGGEDEAGGGRMGRPLDTALHERRSACTTHDSLCDLPCAALRDESGSVVEVCEVEDVEALPGREAYVSAAGADGDGAHWLVHADRRPLPERVLPLGLDGGGVGGGRRPGVQRGERRRVEQPRRCRRPPRRGQCGRGREGHVGGDQHPGGGGGGRRKELWWTLVGGLNTS